MRRIQIQCDHALLRRSLEDTLSDAQEEQLARHLSDCSTCQVELERLAAGGDAWRHVGEVLRREAAGLSGGELLAKPVSDPLAGPPAGLPADTSPVGDVSYELESDFAVDFLEPADAPDMLGRLGEIDILEVIGRGGMGIVLRGYQAALNRPVAVKVLAPHLASSGAARKRFAREAQATAVIVHPNVMPILTVNSSGKLPYLVMPYIPCESLQQRLDREGPLPTLDVLRIGMQLARGLAAAHAQGLVHRDIKPANILLERGVERVLLTDFGLARAADDASLTRTGVIAGTPLYMSPEQARGDAVDARSDLFSLGSVLYALCAGRPPFRAETSYGILRRVIDSEPRPVREVNPDVPVWLSRVLDKLLAKDPNQRMESAERLAKWLEDCLAHTRQPTVMPLPAELQSRSGRFGSLTVAVAGLSIAALGITAVVTARGWILDAGREPIQGPPPGTEITVDGGPVDGGPVDGGPNDGGPTDVGAVGAASRSPSMSAQWGDDDASLLLDIERDLQRLRGGDPTSWTAGSWDAEKREAQSSEAQSPEAPSAEPLP